MFKLSNIENSFDSYMELIKLYDEYKDECFEDITIYLEKWFAANMSATLGAVLDLFGNVNNISLQFDEANQKIKSILCKNNFLSYYGFDKYSDYHNTTIPYLKLKSDQTRSFKDYLIENLINRAELENVSKDLKRRITESILEVFSNAQIHSNSSFIYACGQYFPQKKAIEFTIVDTGVGFKSKISDRFENNFTGSQAINWAVEDKRTSKSSMTGGLGLTVLKEFISSNRGKLQIVSDTGFYEFSMGKTTCKEFFSRFPGTIVNLKFFIKNDGCYFGEDQGKVDIATIF